MKLISMSTYTSKPHPLIYHSNTCPPTATGVSLLLGPDYSSIDKVCLLLQLEPTMLDPVTNGNAVCHKTHSSKHK